MKNPTDTKPTAPATGGHKKDAGKPPLDLLPGPALERVAHAFGFGCRKYEMHNWRNGLTQHRVCGAALRHIYAHLNGEDLDEESQVEHLACAIAEALFALTYLLEGRTELDDRHTASRAEPSPGEDTFAADGRELMHTMSTPETCEDLRARNDDWMRDE